MCCKPICWLRAHHDWRRKEFATSYSYLYQHTICPISCLYLPKQVPLPHLWCLAEQWEDYLLDRLLSSLWRIPSFDFLSVRTYSPNMLPLPLDEYRIQFSWIVSYLSWLIWASYLRMPHTQLSSHIECRRGHIYTLTLESWTRLELFQSQGIVKSPGV